MFFRSTFFAVCIAAFWAFPSAHALVQTGPTETVSRNSLGAHLRTLSMKVEDTTEPGGTPWLTVTTKDGRIFNVFFYVCANQASPASPCEQLQFRILWDNDKRRTSDDVNKFHLEKVYGRGYLTEDRKMIGLEYAMHLKGGVTIGNIVENIEYFLRVVDDFVEIVKP